jgi:hypothetical protein
LELVQALALVQPQRLIPALVLVLVLVLALVLHKVLAQR